ncbi:ABC transporter ATP-binding protein [Paenibacillus baekrokdamisoli]|uniref:ABC transporter ATP-binding protein n=1 Tax=Paenibacillus baekrokdamisoli TaxID=1712516 RepID=A0A3G9IX29_9BACL|nr:ATP-binding cassette domain-containing protein [Paenibacillus baekrokdamisoli]MBB3069942.1 putative ABC transport system ATP-binding protein [Paenibacillus baekrokdamisoli]BBH20705.1 ABC transporter ATP-binding protein [Paenibacillus baekrokdamisoli]
MEPLLRFERLSKTIAGHTPRLLFKEIAASVMPSDKIAIVGPSGQGKSTLLRILSLLELHDAGTIYLQEVCSTAWQPKDWRKKVCYVAQQPFMLEGSVEDNLRAVSKLHRSEYDSQAAEELLSKLGLAGIDKSTHAATLSGGEKQRISLIRSLLLRAEIILLDEITASLDHHHKLAVEQVLEEWQAATGAAWIWITHDMEQAARVANQIWVIEDGSLTIHKDTQKFFSTLSLKEGVEE